jgi:hypothetical protein
MHYFNDGSNGFLWDPLWRRNTGLTDAETALLKHPALRRLRGVPLWGPAGRILPLNVTAWDHALGLFALTAHLRPQDWALRAAALLYPIAANPFGPIVAQALPGAPAELVWSRLDESGLSALLAHYELDPGLVGGLVTGETASPLGGVPPAKRRAILPPADPSTTPSLPQPDPRPTELGAHEPGTYPQPVALLGLAALDFTIRATEALGIGERPAHDLLRSIGLEGNAVAVVDPLTGRELVRRLAADLRTRYKTRPLGLAGLGWAIVTEAKLEAESLVRLTEAEALARAAAIPTPASLVDVLNERPWSVTAERSEAPKGLHLTVSHLPLAEPLCDGGPLSDRLPEAVAILDSLTIIKGAYRVHLS